ncbi:hypothetical protein DPEC_G00063940 [Dallia pectoralis]|uniref:Uncharacterized protein n=1 Tax=Dallia pectoralis TaxID=75939 RepID=A0ACC2H7N0_DALPE|nr:hypothetical protein DPEC_G00063940 [Dallia pectoralis]
MCTGISYGTPPACLLDNSSLSLAGSGWVCGQLTPYIKGTRNQWHIYELCWAGRTGQMSPARTPMLSRLSAQPRAIGFRGYRLTSRNTQTAGSCYRISRLCLAGADGTAASIHGLLWAGREQNRIPLSPPRPRLRSL